MEKEFLDRMRAALQDKRKEVLHSLMVESSNFKATIESMGVKDLADLAADDIDMWRIEAISSQDSLLLSKIDAALGRLGTGHYGICARCSKKISPDRLIAIPYATLCIDCKSASEKR